MPADDMDLGSHPDFVLTGERPVFGPEICNNGLDDDGDGKVDEGCICKPGAKQDCFPDGARLAGIGTLHRWEAAVRGQAGVRRLGGVASAR